MPRPYRTIACKPIVNFDAITLAETINDSNASSKKAVLLRRYKERTGHEYPFFDTKTTLLMTTYDIAKLYIECLEADNLPVPDEKTML